MDSILTTGPMSLLKEYRQVLTTTGIRSRITGPPDGNPNA
jgi:hypothetical protein